MARCTRQVQAHQVGAVAGERVAVLDPRDQLPQPGALEVGGPLGRAAGGQRLQLEPDLVDVGQVSDIELPVSVVEC